MRNVQQRQWHNEIPTPHPPLTPAPHTPPRQVDENVHFRHTARLINALIAARKPYDLLLFPDGRHSLRKAEDRLYLEQRCGRERRDDLVFGWDGVCHAMGLGI